MTASKPLPIKVTDGSTNTVLVEKIDRYFQCTITATGFESQARGNTAVRSIQVAMKPIPPALRATEPMGRAIHGAFRQAGARDNASRYRSADDRRALLELVHDIKDMTDTIEEIVEINDSLDELLDGFAPQHLWLAPDDVGLVAWFQHLYEVVQTARPYSQQTALDLVDDEDDYYDYQPGDMDF